MIKITTKRYRCSEILQEAKNPDLSMLRDKPSFKSTISDYEGLFINYGFRETAYPYTQQNAYSEEREREVTVAVLENDEIYAEFLPTLGGRLWTLYDKRHKKNIIYKNDVIRFRNLAIRNAWFSGGVEWNCGVIGHSPFTCSQMYCAEVKGANGEEVLRFYEYERIRGVYYQMDFWLEGNRLMSAVRIENPNEEVVPMYWWSNMATPEYPGGRVAVAASRAYNNSDGMGIKKSSIPVDRGIDVSYPENIPDTIDYFYDIPDREQKFIANTDKDGFGLLQWSSLRLKGRKLFSWGHRKGSAHWQSLLTDSAGDYVEIQAGLGKTQYECLPMPPKTSWSFAECYTLADIGAQAVRGDYSDFVAAVKAQIAQFGDSDALESRLDDITKDISLQKGELLLRGSGAGSLGDVPPQLEFVGDEESAYWRALSENSDSCGGAVPFPFGARQRDILLENRSRSDWRICYQLALLAYDERNFADAKSLCGESMVYDNNLYNNYLYTFIMHQLGDKNMLYFADKCLTLCRGEYSVTESIFGLLFESGNYGRVISAFPELSDELQKMPRLRMYLAIAYLHSANAEKAQELLLENGGLELLDIREGDRTLDRLYRGIRKELFDEDPKKVTVPEQFDFIVADQKD